MSRLAISKRCLLFEDIASDKWAHIIRNHRTGTQVNEPGITNDIVAEIRDNALADPNIGVWANNGYNEIIHGSDIDIFVETTTGNFLWWALQAKVLRLNQHYEGVSGLHGGEYQWQKLDRLSENSGCIARYLLYNGVNGYSCSEHDYCGRAFSEEQFGCSLITTEEMAQIALQRDPTFRDFHPVPAQPWRIITCCINKKTNDEILYSTVQIKRAVEYYPEVSGDEEIFPDEEALNDDDSKKSYQPKNDFPLDAINQFSESIGRQPMYRMVIRTTASLSE